MPTALKDSQPTGRVLTGRMVLAILLVFFLVDIAANAIMARFAVQTFRGVTNNHAYTDGLAYNREIEAAHAQDALGWQVKGNVTRIAPGRSRITVTQADAAGTPTGDVKLEVKFQHPVDRKLDKGLALAMQQPGVYTGEIEIPPGHWGLALRFSQNGQIVFQSQNKVEISDRTP